MSWQEKTGGEEQETANINISFKEFCCTSKEMMWVVTGVRGGVMSGIVFSVLNGRSCIIFVLFLC